ALALLKAGYLSGPSGLILSALVLLSALYHFADTESKSADHCFIGFPAIWNIVAFYIFALSLSPALASLLVLVCVGLTFVPLHYVHPLRTPRLLPLTLCVVALWTIAAAFTLLRGFPAGPGQVLVLCLTAAYGLGLALVLRRPQAPGPAA